MHPVFYDSQSYRELCRLARDGGIDVPSLHHPNVQDEARCAYRGDEVRGGFYVVEFDPRLIDPATPPSPQASKWVDSGLEQASYRFGKQLVHATAYELLRYALTGWDRETQIVACGTTLQVIQGRRSYSKKCTTEPSFVYMMNDGGYSRICAGSPQSFAANSQVLCVVPLDTE